MTIIIRDFELKDIENGLLETYKEVWSINGIAKNQVDEFLLNDNHMAVCEIDGEVVGTATLHLQKKFIRDGGLAGFIEDVAVREKLRSQNIGSKLIQYLLGKAKEFGCYKVVLSCFPERVEFYKRNGFIQESITMRFSIK